MELAEALAFASGRRHGALVTIGRSGRPQLSMIVYAMDGPVARISVTADRVKTANLRRDPRASLYVVGDNPWAWVVLEGTAELSDVAASTHDPVTEELVELYRTVGGQHPDWEEYRQAMVTDGRLVVRLRATRAYGILT